MREFSSPLVVEVDPNQTLADQLWVNERENPDRIALAYREGDHYRDITNQLFAHQVKRIAAGLIAAGIQPGDRVCIFSPTRYEFTLFDYAIWTAGGATVTIYETSSADQVEWIVGDSGSVGIICASPAIKEVFDHKAAQLGSCQHVWVMDKGAVEQLIEAGQHISDEQVMERAQAVTPENLATLVYTSGTTGRPKGCMISHRNFVHTIEQVRNALPDVIPPGETNLMFLPLAHIFARLVQVGCVASGMRIAYATGIPQLREELVMTRPWFVFSVPRVFEKIYNGARSKAEDDGRAKIFDRAAQVAIRYSQEKQAGRVKLGTRFWHTLFDRLVYRKIRAVMGGNVGHTVSGGAALGERLGHFFSGIGIQVLEGYGLTETTAVLSFNTQDAVRIGTVGRPAPGYTIRIGEDGEILAKGPGVFLGYWNNPEATAEAIDADGWFHTGDLGELDDQGFLRITGRKKEIIVTAGGKNVAPQLLEDTIRSHPLVGQAMVVGDDRPFVAALITIDPEFFEIWVRQQEKEGTLEELMEDNSLQSAIAEAVDGANQLVSQAEAVRKFHVLAKDFTIETGELTPTLKVKREVVAEKYASEINALYGE